jgi:polysaccharide deacetylase family protein (PEP-CTERM system associated)
MTAAAPPLVNALSVDVEEYYHGVEFETALSRSERDRLPSRVEPSVDRVLDVLEQHAVRATFFTVGTVAREHPAMVRRIAEAGHEVACHSYRHELISRQTPGEFRNDVCLAKAVLEDISGHAVIGYRAPNFSIGRAETWAYAVLGEAGFRYDSSVYPIRHDRYGDPRAPRFPFEIRVNGCAGLIQFPIGTVRLLGVNLPIGGGGYFRLFPASWIRRGIHRVNDREARPVMFYFHPWELDPDQPRPPMRVSHRFRHYVNLHRFARKLEGLLRTVPFAPARDVLGLPDRSGPASR